MTRSHITTTVQHYFARVLLDCHDALCNPNAGTETERTSALIESFKKVGNINAEGLSINVDTKELTQRAEWHVPADLFLGITVEVYPLPRTQHCLFLQMKNYGQRAKRLEDLERQVEGLLKITSASFISYYACRSVVPDRRLLRSLQELCCECGCELDCWHTLRHSSKHPWPFVLAHPYWPAAFFHVYEDGVYSASIHRCEQFPLGEPESWSRLMDQLSGTTSLQALLLSGFCTGLVGDYRRFWAGILDTPGRNGPVVIIEGYKYPLTARPKWVTDYRDRKFTSEQGREVPNHLIDYDPIAVRAYSHVRVEGELREE